MLQIDMKKILIDFQTFLFYTMKQLFCCFFYCTSRSISGIWDTCFNLGFETSPASETADYENHITGDISQAFYFYLLMTNDTDLMKKGKGADVINSIAEFWASRVTLDTKTGFYHINSKI